MPEANRDEIDQTLEASERVLDPRLDNRMGKDRPVLESFPAKPQQIDGPDVTDTLPRPEEVKKAEENSSIPRKGMFSPGPHGLGDTKAVPFEEAVENPEKAVTANDRAKAASTAKSSGAVTAKPSTIKSKEETK